MDDGPARSVYDLARNALEAALDLRRRKRASGDWRPEDDEIIAKLQDDPAELFRRIRHLDDGDDSAA